MEREKAIKRILNGELSTADILCAFDIIGREYLDGEQSFVNHPDGLFDLINEFDLESNDILNFMLDNPYYCSKDLFVTFDGETLTSFRDIEYFENMLIKKMNGECADFILGIP